SPSHALSPDTRAQGHYVDCRCCWSKRRLVVSTPALGLLADQSAARQRPLVQGRTKSPHLAALWFTPGYFLVAILVRNLLKHFFERILRRSGGFYLKIAVCKIHLD